MRPQQAHVGLTNAHCPVAEGQRCFGVQDLHPGGNSQGTLQDVPEKPQFPTSAPRPFLNLPHSFSMGHRAVSAGEKTPEAGDDKLTHFQGCGDIPPSAALSVLEVRFPLMASAFLSVLFIFQFSASVVMLGYLSTECSVCSVESVCYANNVRAFRVASYGCIFEKTR